MRERDGNSLDDSGPILGGFLFEILIEGRFDDNLELI
jgi:hypothetical protein